MKIVAYHPKFAASIADMWNKSSPNWGNDDELKTEQEVIDQEKNSGNIKVYLAIDKDEVVGYCSFSVYRQDEGASYLPLINVRPDYIGKKIGKALILKVLEDAKQSKWPRFDLYTWSGNIGAMPLYKKCGFFWERRNNSVHLMNFLPYVCQTEALQTYVNQLDLYIDSTREIDMNMDGEDENGFDIYYYHFKNKDTYLSLGFEKTARGLVYIDNPDYQMRLTLDQHKLVFNQSYQASLKIINKAKETLDINIQGSNDKNIIHNFQASYHIEDTLEIKLPFTIYEQENIQDLEKTHPSVALDVFVNGKKVHLKCGVLTKYPLEMNLRTVEMIHSKNEVYNAYLDLENNLDKEATFTIKLPNTNVEFFEDVQVRLRKDEKRSVKIPYSVNSFGFYHEEVDVMFNNTSHKKVLKAMFKGTKESFVCNLDKQVCIVSGNSVMTYEKQSHNINYSNTFDQRYDMAISSPKIGLPYSLEFSNNDPEIKVDSNNQITLVHKSESFKDVILNILILNRYGLLEITYEIVNKGEEKNLSLSIPVNKSIQNLILPYQSGLLNIGDDGGFIGNIDLSKLDENWMYNNKLKQGFLWPKALKIKNTQWYISFDLESIQLKQNQSFRLDPIIVSNIHPTVKDFRKYLLSKDDRFQFGFMTLDINGFNPFIDDSAKAKFINHRKAQVKGIITNNSHTCDIGESLPVSEGLQVFKIELADRIIEEKRFLFRPHGSVLTKEDSGIYTVDNGVLTYKADANYSDSVFSLIFNQQEWLDSNYPTPKERAWWASFVGGIAARISGIQDVVAINEERIIDFVEIKDNFNNQWSGLKITTHYQNDSILKGVSICNYILTMPGLPLIHIFTDVINQSGALIHNKVIYRRYTINYDITKENVRFNKKDMTYKITDQSIEVDIDHALSLESIRDHKLVFYSAQENSVIESQKEYIMFFAGKALTVPDKENKIFNGDYIFFTNDKVKKEDLCLFKYIKFEV